MTDAPPRSLEYVPIDAIKVAKWNPKLHNEQLIADSIEEHGFVTPMVLDDRTGELVAGHGRRDDLLTRRASGAEPPEGIVVDDDGAWLVPVVRGWRSRTKAQAEKFLVADNATSAAGGVNETAMAERLAGWAEKGQLRGTGYTPASAEQLLAGLRPPPRQNDPEVPDQPVVPVSQVGDVWLLGDGCRLMCGDSTSHDDMATLMAGEPADHVFTSPPYNVNVEYEDHDDKTVPWPQYRAFLMDVVARCIEVLAPGRVLGWNVSVASGAYHYRQAVMLEDAGLHFLRQLIWRKVGVVVPCWHFTLDNPVVRQLTPNYQHELVYLFSKGDLERGGPATIDGVLEHDVFTINQAMSTRTLANDRTKPHSGASNLDRRAQKEHPAVFPLDLPRTFIGHLADVGAIVLDPFAGSGTTLIAAHVLGRRGYGMEKGRGYTDVACRRWQAATGLVPVLEATGEAHDFGPGA
jgi:DNA modification methylase